MKKIKDDSELFGCGVSILAFVIGCIVTFIGLTQFNYTGTHQFGFSLLGGLGLMILVSFSLLFYNWMVERICKKYGHKGCVCQRCGVEKHDWDGCICRQCGKTNTNLPDEYHDWDGCICRKCGKKRDVEHEWDGCKCKRCGSSGNHDWGDGCVCRRCGTADQYRPDETHEWNGCICRRCGTERDIEHEWYGCACRKCDKKRDVEHDLDDTCKCRQCGKVRHDGYQYDSVFVKGQRGGVEDWLLPGDSYTYYYRCRRCGAEWTESCEC